MPVSKRRPSGVRRRRDAPCTAATSRRPRREHVGRCPGAGRRTCTASRAGRRRRRARDVDRLVRGVVDRVDPRQRAGARARARTTRRASAIVPTAFDAQANATTRVRSDSLARRSSRSSVVSSWTSRRGGRRGRGRARARARARRCRRGRGAETRISSPSAEVAARRSATEREVQRRHVGAEDDLVPARSRGSAPSAARRSSRIASTRWLVAYGAPRFALASRRRAPSPRRPRRGPASRRGRRRTRSRSCSEEKRPSRGRAVERRACTSCHAYRPSTIAHA